MENASYMQGSDAFNYNVFYSKDPKYKDKGGTEFKKHGQADEMRDKYFEQDDTGGYKLKEGYVQRHIGTGDLDGKLLGAEMSYASAVDDDNNEKENLSKRNNYGIFKKEVPKSDPAPAVQTSLPEDPAEPVKKEQGPIEYSPEVAQAKERVNKYTSMIDGNMGSTFSGANAATTPQKDPQATADKYKLNLINKGLV